jgi:hypothetical protein
VNFFFAFDNRLFLFGENNIQKQGSNIRDPKITWESFRVLQLEVVKQKQQPNAKLVLLLS